MDTRTILERLIAFETVSAAANLPLIEWARDLLAAAGARLLVVPDATGTKANLHATIGPADRPGVLLSGHTDVVPVEGQAWTRPPFRLTEAEGRLYGRGAADMKGFVAAALACALAAARRPLRTPLHLALSHDEEVGCIGVRALIDLLAQAPVRPLLCIVGEPTGMAVATGHKGKRGLRAVCRGREGHSALAPLAMNAIHLAADLTAELRALQARIVATGRRDGDYDVPYTTVHVGRIAGGASLNIVPNRCELDLEFRHLAEDDPAALRAEIDAAAARVVAAAADPDAAIEIAEFMDYPGLGTPPDAAAVAFVKGLTGANGTIKVAFGTEGGLFHERLGVPTVVCGPGSMAQGHRPDEYVTTEQLARCDAMLAALLDRLEAGL
ncbi:acetylornithine deacetylase [Amaricoccus sp.]|uniref:acetylornithine deacetylase n=1 Tax=Amaricoccus sp. TaxID=1872485 RepID=UPI001B4FEA25|nr:acetylornithine deacetylase [Amaricoccus sp.]MBP7002229.1 acetylornithine deacetylase [Amaricoccus sp.]